MRRTSHLLVPLAGLLALGVVVPAVATATPAAPRPTVSFSASSYSVSEAAGNATITAVRHGAGKAVTVNFATHWGTAKPGRDYRTTLATLTIPAGASSTSSDVQVPVIDNSVADADRSFTVTLKKPTRYRLASPSTAKVTIVNDDAPAAPSGLTATANGADEIDLAWTANSDHVTGYQVLRSTTSGGPYTQIGTSTTNSYSDTGLAAGTYYYVVQAVNPAGTSPNSNEASATLGATQINLIYDGDFETGFSGWNVHSSPGSSISLDQTAPHGGTYSAHLSSDGSRQTYPSMQGNFFMPVSGTVTFTAWYKAALSGSDYADITLYDYDADGGAGEYIGSGFQLTNTTVAGWTQTDPVEVDASTRAGHLIAVQVDMIASGVSSFEVDDFTALVN